jgi:hypothetical protein
MDKKTEEEIDKYVDMTLKQEKVDKLLDILAEDLADKILDNLRNRSKSKDETIKDGQHELG